MHPRPLFVIVKPASDLNLLQQIYRARHKADLKDLLDATDLVEMYDPYIIFIFIIFMIWIVYHYYSLS